MNKAAKNIIVITLITVVAGLLLGYVYEITKEPIKQQELLSKQLARQAVFQTASTFEEISSVSLDDFNASVLENGYSDETVDEALTALDGSGNAIGYVFGITTHEGYGGDISISMGVANDGTVLGVEILSISETAGLGMKADTDEFKAQFADRNVSRFSYTKSGKTADYEIDALSGATITTNAMTNAVNAGLCCFEKVGGGR